MKAIFADKLRHFHPALSLSLSKLSHTATNRGRKQLKKHQNQNLIKNCFVNLWWSLLLLVTNRMDITMEWQLPCGCFKFSHENSSQKKLQALDEHKHSKKKIKIPQKQRKKSQNVEREIYSGCKGCLFDANLIFTDSLSLYLSISPLMICLACRLFRSTLGRPIFFIRCAP